MRPLTIRYRAQQGSAQSGAMLPHRHLLLTALALAAFACGNDKLRSIPHGVEVVGGEPGVGQGLPGVDRADAGPGGIVYGSAAPYQVDTFTQQQVQKVDILWVVDNSPSMEAKQARVKDNFQSFMQFLTAQQIDYHLGVVTTDTYDPAWSGRLVNNANLAHPWIDLAAADPQNAFQLNASVGTVGSGDEKGLLAGMLALTPPLSPPTPALPATGAANCADKGNGVPECFLRADVPLYTIIVSDEEDSSCAPIYSGGINNTEGCDDAKASGVNYPGGYGSTAYWARFYSGLKQQGGTSRVAAITGLDATLQDCQALFGPAAPHSCSDTTKYPGFAQCAGAPACTAAPSHPCCTALAACHADVFDRAQWCDVRQVVNSAQPAVAVSPYFTVNGQFNGCVSRDVNNAIQFSAFTGTRYAAVANETGGIAASICDQDYTPALSRLGLQAAGLRSDFPLSRAPIRSSISVRVGGALSTAWTYPCTTGVPPNVVRFAPPPSADSKVEIRYDVDVRGLGTCP